MTIPAVMPTYARADLAFERGEGARLWTTDGREFLDFNTGIAVTGLGHAHPHLVKALQGQAEKFWHCSNLYRIPDQERAADRLIANSFADTAFFCNSGAEAMECAIKVARRHHFGENAQDRVRIITFEGAFHGRTYGGLAAGNNAKHIAGFGPMLEGFDQVPFGNMNALRDAIQPETAAILLEPVQGEGGVNQADPEFLKAVRLAADEFGLLVILDEVQCGMGRTGHLFAHQAAGITPDIVALAKGLGGGFPVGACLATEKAAQHMVPGTHGSTFGGNPLAMSVVNAVLDVMLDPAFMSQVNAATARLDSGLNNLVADFPDVFSGLRGTGMMRGLVCTGAAADMVNAGLEAGILTVGAAGEVVRVLPPLTISDDDIDLGVSLLARAAKSVQEAL